MAQSARKEELIADLVTARNELVGYGQALGRDCAVGVRLKNAVKTNPPAWFAGAAVLGLLLSKIPPARKKVVVKGFGGRRDETRQAGKAAFLLALIKFAIDLGKPFLTQWAKRRFFSGGGGSAVC